MVLNPKHGYGANLNPCLDCKIFMVNQATLMINKARELAGDRGFDFIVTGEVIGQRPKSQRKETMPIISQESGADDRLLRPLCAQNLPPTLPEREGWVNRDELHDFSGRNRKPQMALAAKFGLDDFAQPAGGCCFLTDESYSNKLADLWKARNERRYELDDIMLLKVGRHLRPQPHYKLIISREEGENRFLEGYRYQFTSITTVSCPGPLALVDEEMPGVGVAPNDQLLEKLKSNMEEVRARGGRLYVFSDPETDFEPQEGVEIIRVTRSDRTQYGGQSRAVDSVIAPILYTIPLQLLAYHVALIKGTDVDKPRNLAKSVTVE